MDDDLAIGCGGLALVLLALLIFGGVADAVSCSAKFSGSALPHKWGLFSGCLVHDPKQGWVPAENYRVL